MIKEYLNHDHPNVPNFYNAICLQSQVFGYGRIYVYVGSFKTSLFSNLRRTISGLCNDYIALCYPTKFWKIVGKKFLSRLLDCSTQCGQCCGCFGFNTLTKVCRVIKTCDKADVTEHEEGWTYHYLRDLHEKGEFRSTVQLESTLSSSHTCRNGDVPFILFFPLLVNTFPVYK